MDTSEKLIYCPLVHFKFLRLAYQFFIRYCFFSVRLRNSLTSSSSCSQTVYWFNDAHTRTCRYGEILCEELEVMVQKVGGFDWERYEIDDDATVLIAPYRPLHSKKSTDRVYYQFLLSECRRPRWLWFLIFVLLLHTSHARPRSKHSQ